MIADMIKLVVDAHQGQTTKNGAPYVTHPIWVASKFDPIKDQDLYLAALGHDLFEMTTVTKDQLVEIGVSNRVIETIDQLTRKPHETYVKYINRVRQCPASTRVKLADIHHHLYRHAVGEGTIPDDLVKRYESAVSILVSMKL